MAVTVKANVHDAWILRRSQFPSVYRGVERFKQADACGFVVLTNDDYLRPMNTEQKSSF